jgi:hypothetical protein
MLTHASSRRISVYVFITLSPSIATAEPWKDGTWKRISVSKLCEVQWKCIAPPDLPGKVWLSSPGFATTYGTEHFYGCKIHAPNQSCSYCIELRTDCDIADLDADTIRQECCGVNRSMRQAH